MTTKKIKWRNEKEPEKTEHPKKWNYELVVAGQQVNIIAHTMTEPQARGILDHFVKGAGLNDIVFSVKRLTPEPVNWGYDFTGDVAGSNTISFTNSPTLNSTDWAWPTGIRDLDNSG